MGENSEIKKVDNIEVVKAVCHDLAMLIGNSNTIKFENLPVIIVFELEVRLLFRIIVLALILLNRIKYLSSFNDYIIVMNMEGMDWT